MMRIYLVILFISLNVMTFSQSNNSEIIFPDVEAGFVGGVNAMNNYINDNIVYPEKALVKDKVSKVYVVFTVESDGSITNVKAKEGHYLLRKEAERLVANMPAWKPAELNGEKIRQRCQIPINFVIK